LMLLGLIFAARARVMYKDWRRRRTEVYDHCPDNLASVLIRLCASRFVEETTIQLSRAIEKEAGLSTRRGSAMEEEQEQRQRYEGVDGEKRYKFGLMKGVDGVNRYIVDLDTSER
jgi:hypothetical protein